MTAQLYIAPAASGKTAWVVSAVRQAAQGLARTPVVVVATPQQARSLRNRLAQAGGAIGVRILTFDDLYAAVLQACGAVHTELSDPVRFRLVRMVIETAAAKGELPYYAALANRPGFVAEMQALIDLFKGARISPEAFAQALAATVPADGAPVSDAGRLHELALIYARYQQVLQANRWSDRAGMGWLALEALRRPEFSLPPLWSPIFFDGFASFTQVQRDVIAALAAKTPELVVTLTGEVEAANERAARAAHRLYAKTAHELRQALGMAADPLPTLSRQAAAPFAFLCDHLFLAPAPEPPQPDGLALVCATNRTTEVRAALRRLKQHIVEHGCRAGEAALLARNLQPYRDVIVQTAAEFGIPIQLLDGLPLLQNPAVAALLNLLQLSLPEGGESSGEQGGSRAMPRRQVLEAWRSPYFDWCNGDEECPDAPAIQPGDADRLAQVARSGRVVRGEAQWREALAQAAQRAQVAAGEAEGDATEGEAEAVGPELQAIRELTAKFDRFVQVLTPPAASASFETYVRWIEDLIGDDPRSHLRGGNGYDTDCAPAAVPFSLNLIARIRSGPPELASRDLAAINTFKDVLRGLVWAEHTVAALDGGELRSVDYAHFLGELMGAMQAAAYSLPPTLEGGVLVASTVEARGLPLAAVAILGLAEGELPQRIGEDPFLRDRDRQLLREQGLPIELSTVSTERELFYDAVARARDWLLLTRPNLADTGALWEPSPYWQEVQSLLRVEPETVNARSTGILPASTGELLQVIAHRPQAAASALAWLEQTAPGRWARVRHGAAMHLDRHRSHARQPSIYDGDLADLAALLTARYGPDHMWSASRIEQYLTCRFYFFAATVLSLAADEEPGEGMDSAQLGTLYHDILEHVYQAADPTDLEALLAALPRVAKPILDAAPARLGFRTTRWWEQERQAIVDKAAETLAALHEISRGYRPIAFEQYFGGESAPLVVEIGDQTLRLRGVIDRVDRHEQTGSLRIIDYKTGGSGYDRNALREGKKIQLAVYALGAQDALRLGPVEEGFYWLINPAKKSSLTLAGFETDEGSGPDAAIKTALRHIHAGTAGIAAGLYHSQPPTYGCPGHCPASAFCARYRPRHQDS